MKAAQLEFSECGSKHPAVWHSFSGPVNAACGRPWQGKSTVSTLWCECCKCMVRCSRIKLGHMHGWRDDTAWGWRAWHRRRWGQWPAGTCGTRAVMGEQRGRESGRRQVLGVGRFGWVMRPIFFFFVYVDELQEYLPEWYNTRRLGTGEELYSCFK
jgi:hypothetical protein